MKKVFYLIVIFFVSQTFADYDIVYVNGGVYFKLDNIDKYKKVEVSFFTSKGELKSNIKLPVKNGSFFIKSSDLDLNSSAGYVIVKSSSGKTIINRSMREFLNKKSSNDINHFSIEKDTIIIAKRGELLKICLSKSISEIEFRKNDIILENNAGCIEYISSTTASTNVISSSGIRNSDSVNIKIEIVVGMVLYKLSDKTHVVKGIKLNKNMNKGKRNVSFDYDILIDEFEVSYYDYQELMSDYIYPNFARAYRTNMRNLAVTTSFVFAILYANRRSLRDGLEPVYSYDIIQTATCGHADRVSEFHYPRCNIKLTNLYVNKNKNGYRLPEYIEWQVIIYENTNSYFSNLRYSDTNIIKQYEISHGMYKSNVTSVKPGDLGIYNMVGNVTEFAGTRFDSSSFLAPQQRSEYKLWSDEEDVYMGVLGGSTRATANILYRCLVGHIAHRPASKSHDVGIRLYRTINKNSYN